MDVSDYTINGPDAISAFNNNGGGEVLKAPNDSSFDDFDQQSFSKWNAWRNPRKGHIRDAFINSAVDETLARSIFRTISSGKPNGSVTLERLKVRVSGGGIPP